MSTLLCKDCSRDTKDEYYMLRDEIWLAAHGKKILVTENDYYNEPQGESLCGFLCIRCVEQRLGRKLEREDFDLSCQVSIDFLKGR